MKNKEINRSKESAADLLRNSPAALGKADLKAAEEAGGSALPIGEQQVKEFTRILQKYKNGKAHTERRILASENWWKLRNTAEEQRTTRIGADGGFRSVSGWLHNVIVSKHADAMDAYPAPGVLPREPDDRQQANILSQIIPCILEQNRFEHTYSDAMWQKLKTGTGVYKIVWDQSRLNGLGDIAIERVNLLNLYWEPGITDIQRSRYFFHTELADKELLRQTYPELLSGRLKTPAFLSTRFLYDDAVDTSGKSAVVDWYYKKRVGGRTVLHLCKFVAGIHEPLFASENEPAYAERGWYDHGAARARPRASASWISAKRPRNTSTGATRPFCRTCSSTPGPGTSSAPTGR